LKKSKKRPGLRRELGIKIPEKEQRARGREMATGREKIANRLRSKGKKKKIKKKESSA